DVSGHYDLPLLPYRDQDGQWNGPLANAQTDFATLYLSGERASVAVDFPSMSQPVSADTVFVFNYTPGQKTPLDQIVRPAVGFAGAEDLTNDTQRLCALVSNGQFGQDQSMNMIRRADGSFDVTIRLGAYLADNYRVIIAGQEVWAANTPHYRTIAFVSTMQP